MTEQSTFREVLAQIPHDGHYVNQRGQPIIGHYANDKRCSRCKEEGILTRLAALSADAKKYPEGMDGIVFAFFIRMLDAILGPSGETQG